MSYLYRELLDYQASDAYPFHMPGHKRRREGIANPFLIDITEIDGFDNLHHAEGILREAQDRAAELYGAEETHYLVNGSTGGILSAIAVCSRKSGRILMARNCHKAAYHGALLQELDITYLYPEAEQILGINGGISPEETEALLQRYPDTQAVMITSPTFDGVVSDVERIAEAAHRHGVPLIVDEAHGAHFGFHPYFPASSVKLGADLVIHSLHKTLPSLTQTALLHVNGSLIDRERLERYLGIFQTSSPSYVLMAGMDECVRIINGQGAELFEGFAGRLKNFYEAAGGFLHIQTAGAQLAGRNQIFDFDRSKLVLSVRGTTIDGNRLQQILRDNYHLELEMAAGSYALALTSLMDSDEGFFRLCSALQEIDSGLERSADQGLENTVTRNESCMKISRALEGVRETVSLSDAAERISGEFLYLYPPGIPLLVPGERIDIGLILRVKHYVEHGYSIQGLLDYSASEIQVLV